jgi:hydrogenase nickel incorporation protein HypB
MIQRAQQHGDATAGDEKGFGHPPASALIRKALAQAEVLGIRLIGHPGSGKTELVNATLNRLPAPKRAVVVVVNPASTRDADRLHDHCGRVVHIDAAIADATPIWHAISELKLEHFDLLLIEAAGGLAPLHDLGQDATVAVFSVSGGDDKAAEYHALINSASAIVLTKTDLRSLVKFNGEVFRNDVHSINSSAEIFELSAITGLGMLDWLRWLERARAAKNQSRSHDDPHDWTSDRFIG